MLKITVVTTGFYSFVCSHKQLKNICNYLRLPQPIYTLYKIVVRQCLAYVRFGTRLEHTIIGKPFTFCVGRFARSKYDAKEDVAAMLIRLVLNIMGRKIRHFITTMSGFLKEKTILLKKRNCSCQWKLNY
jgi:hypothetical protein